MADIRHEEVKQYLLGGAAPETQRTIEERLLTEESFLEELNCTEEELIDDYVGDHLNAGDRASFEQHFLSTQERHRKLRFALALTRYSAEKARAKSVEPSPARKTMTERLRAFWRGQPVLLRAAAALAAAAILAVAWWFSFPRTQSPRTFAALSLSVSASNRGEGAQVSKVLLPLKADALKISLQLPEGVGQASRYRVELLDDKDEARTLEITGRDEKSVSVVIPADQLVRGQYALRLYAAPDGGAEQRVPGSYFFIAE